MKTITVFLAFMLCCSMFFSQKVSARSSQNVVLKEIQSGNISQPVDSIRQDSNQNSRKGANNPEQRIQTQFIPLNQGWSGISSYLNPDDPAVAQMMAAIEQQLVILKDFNGNIYRPSTQSTLANWDFRQGYFIKMASAETLEIIGLEPLSKQIDLQTGWNLIPVLSGVEVNIEEYFFDNNAKIEIVAEVAGLNVFWPDKEIATLTQLTPGKAYLVKAKEPFSLFRLPTVATATISDITTTTAISGGSVDEIGSSPVNTRGIVWNTDGNPTIDSNQGITLDGQGAGEFVSTLTGLIPGTFYYVRAYATNNVGTAYGVELVFVTLQDLLTCGGTFTDSRDSVQYQTVQIGNQCWMAENLAYLPAVSPADQGSMTDPNYYVYGYLGTSAANAKATANFQNYGALYNWPASLTACPQGWHLPAQSEWIALTDLLGGAPNAGGKLKSIRTSPDDHPRWDSPNTGATNESGFTALPGGLRRYYGIFEYIGSIGNFWSATEDSQEYSWFRALNNNAIHVGQSITFKSNGFSVRCVWNENLQGSLPTIQTNEITSITSTSAISGGNISDDGGTPVTMRGVCWSTSESPTIQEYLGRTFDGTGTGEFVSELTNLLPETTYFARAYATNSAGTAYGDQMSFTTPVLTFVCGNIFTDSRDGHQYSTLLLGEQCWMAENLNIGTRIEGTTEQTNNATIEKYCYDNSEANCDVFGGLYQWDEIMDYTTTEGVQGICPTGWSLPTDAEWSTLANYVGTQPAYLCNSNEYQIAKALAATTLWNASTGTCHVGNNLAANNATGFTGLPGGYRETDGEFYYQGNSIVFWSSTENSSADALYRLLYYWNSNLLRIFDDKNYGHYVRCLRDESQTNLPTVITSDVINITSNSALCGGNVTDDGGFAVSTCGVVWSTFESPTIEINEGFSYDASGIGEFSSNLSNLIPETEYFVRAYATNNIGTAYGNQMSFTTQALPFVCGNNFTDSRDGKQYATVQIGDQCWMSENLAYLPIVSPPSEGSYEDPLYYVYGYNGYSTAEAKTTPNYQNYGALYNWTASSTACPQGWYLPTDDDWKILEANADSQYGIGNPVWDIASWRGYDVGKNLKTITGWENYTGTDLVGFSALPGGYRYISGDFLYLTQSGVWWTSSENTTTASWSRYLNSYYDQSYRYPDEKNFGFSVRCMIDQSQTSLPTVITSEVVSITSNSALCGGNVTGEGGSDVSARGVVWNTLENPTIEINEGISYDGTGTGEYVSYLANLNPEAQYFVRAYASNSNGTAYGEQRSFYTAAYNDLCEALDNCGLSFFTNGDAQWFAQMFTSHDGQDAAQSGDIEDDQEVWMETTIEGPGIVSFWWKVISEEDFDYLRFHIDDFHQDAISGYVDWQYQEYTISAGIHTIRWIYTKDGSVSYLDDCGWVDQVQFTPVESICEAVDNCTLYFATGGDAPFFSQTITTFDGEDAAQSGVIENNGQSWLETIVEGPGTLTFYWKVSSETDYDYLKFYIDGVLVDEMSGEVDWHYKEFGIPEGFISLTWYYTKNGSGSSGQDAGWVDQVQYSRK